MTSPERASVIIVVIGAVTLAVALFVLALGLTVGGSVALEASGVSTAGQFGATPLPERPPPATVTPRGAIVVPPAQEATPTVDLEGILPTATFEGDVPPDEIPPIDTPAVEEPTDPFPTPIEILPGEEPTEPDLFPPTPTQETGGIAPPPNITPSLVAPLPPGVTPPGITPPPGLTPGATQTLPGPLPTATRPAATPQPPGQPTPTTRPGGYGAPTAPPASPTPAQSPTPYP